MQSNWHSDWLITNMVGLQTDFLIGLIAIMLLANFPWSAIVLNTQPVTVFCTVYLELHVQLPN